MIRVIDFEATTSKPGGRVIEVGWCDFDPPEYAVLGGGGYLCGGVDAPLPPDARAVHHIRHEELAGLPRYDARLLFEHAMRDGIFCLAAHSADFEATHLIGSLPLICTYKAALRVWPDAPSHKNFGLLYWLEDQGVEFDRARAWPPHRAASDAYATAIVLREIMRTGATGADLFQWTRQPALIPRCPLGRWRDYLWEDVPTDFLLWILRTIFDRDDVRFCAALELDRREGTDDE